MTMAEKGLMAFWQDNRGEKGRVVAYGRGEQGEVAINTTPFCPETKCNSFVFLSH